MAAQPDEGVLSNVRMPGVPIPANGAIVIEGLGTDELVIEVLDSSGAMIAGTYRRVGESAGGGALYAWLPDRPFAPGTYAVKTLAVSRAARLRRSSINFYFALV